MPHTIIISPEASFGARNYLMYTYERPYLYCEHSVAREIKHSPVGIVLSFSTLTAAKAFMECRHVQKYRKFLKYCND